MGTRPGRKARGGRIAETAGWNGCRVAIHRKEVGARFLRAAPAPAFTPGWRGIICEAGQYWTLRKLIFQDVPAIRTDEKVAIVSPGHLVGAVRNGRDPG